MAKVVKRINALEADMEALDGAALSAKTTEFRERLDKGESLDSLLPEAFAVVREASRRTIGLRHFDVQLIGGIALHKGKIAEMRTGEGKTLVATLPVYLNALTGRGVYVVTVNDYLARRDAAWMGPIYEFLGMSVGTITPNQDMVSKRAAYQSDICYGTNNEFGFDYLRDNMVFSLEDRVQRDLHYAIVDEVDSILIDEARTPLIISGPSEDSSKLYQRINVLIPLLEEAAEGGEGHFTVDEKQRQVELTEFGHNFVEQWLIEDGLLEEGDSLYQATNLGLLHHVYSALRAHRLFHRDVEYIVQNGQAVLIDEHTGRTMPGRRLSEGLHQAIEAKEKVKIQAESQTLASTTFQNYFRLFDKLAGMTGTADTEASEFHQIYGLDVVVIPTNKPLVRKDLNDLVYLSKEEKFEAIVADIRSCMEKDAPVLVGTASIETSEELSSYLKKVKIPHQVLNAKYHEKEAEIIAQAGRPGTVTIATNMAGRGTDIVLGGNLEAELTALGEGAREEQKEDVRRQWQARHDRVIEAGGLHILGTERHESRRIDNQLRGRAGRQGDPGVTRFYLSLEDNLMRIFASERVKNFMQALGMERGESIEHRMVSNAIEKAQRKVEGRNFDIRKQLLEFDDVANEQRKVIYKRRNDLLSSEDISDAVKGIRGEVVRDLVAEYVPPQSIEEQWDIPGLEKTLSAEFGVDLPLQSWLDEDHSRHEDELREHIEAALAESYEARTAPLGNEVHKLERHVMLQVLDTQWKEHLATMDQLRQGIHLRAYAAKNPKQEYKREAFQLFSSMMRNCDMETIRFLSRVQIRTEEELSELERQRREAQERERARARAVHAEATALAAAAGAEDAVADDAEAAPERPQTVVREGRKVGRNEPCPCGSGKKYKQCHGRVT
jgi:preprotein translocase subunit SecA